MKAICSSWDERTTAFRRSKAYRRPATVRRRRQRPPVVRRSVSLSVSRRSMDMRFKWPAVTAVAVLASSCTHIDPVSQSPDPQFGEAVKYDMAAQTINPDPVYPDDAAQPGEDGARAAAAVKRLRTD